MADEEASKLERRTPNSPFTALGNWLPILMKSKALRPAISKTMKLLKKGQGLGGGKISLLLFPITPNNLKM